MDGTLIDELRLKTDKLEKIEAALVKSERIMSTILEAVPVGICLVDNRIVIWSNQALAESFGYLREEITGFPIKNLYITDEEYERVGEEVYTKHLSGQKVGNIPAKMLNRSGNKMDVLLRVSFVNGESPNSTMVITVIVNLAELKKQCDDFIPAKA
jgi:PAS domain S-box-containing protein